MIEGRGPENSQGGTWIPIVDKRSHTTGPGNYHKIEIWTSGDGDGHEKHGGEHMVLSED